MTATVLVLAVVVTIVCAAGRVLRGPTHADRIVAVELVLSASIAAIAAAALTTGRALLLDVGIGVALVGFVGTLAWCRLVDAGTDGRRE